MVSKRPVSLLEESTYEAPRLRPDIKCRSLITSQFETYHGQGEKEHHGFDGPIHVSGGTYRAKDVEDQFIEAASYLGYPELKDLQNLDANNATERWLRYVGPDGLRQDAAHRYSKFDIKATYLLTAFTNLAVSHSTPKATEREVSQSACARRDRGYPCALR